MKKFLLVLSSVLAFSFAAAAQDAFYPGWQYSIKGGAAYTVGETSFGKLISPSAAISAGYQFTPVFTLRGDLSGWQGKGHLSLYNETYKFNYLQFAVDGVFDVCNIFKHKWSRVVNPYIFAGIGVNVRFNNKEANAIADHFLPTDYLWSKTTASFMARLGAGIDFKVSEKIRLSLEYDHNVLSDRFNSKKTNAKLDCDYQLQLLAGIKFTFGQAKKKAAADAAALAAAEAAAAKAAAEKAEAERLAAEKAAAEKAAREAAAKAAAEKAAREAAEKAAAEAAAAKAAHEKAVNDAIADPAKNIFFTIGKSYINSSEAKKIKTIAKALNENPAYKITVFGYADKNTGSSKLNWKLSENRTKAVKAALVKAGVSEDRISTEFFGDTKQVSTVPSKNRVAICVTE